jgi:hypothetical protein
MSNKLQQYVDERIGGKTTQFAGQVISAPAEKTVGGQPAFVVDILVDVTSSILKNVVIAPNNRSIQDTATIGQMVVVEKSSSGQFAVVGRSNRLPANKIKTSYLITDLGFLAFTQGMKLSDVAGSLETGNGNTISEGTHTITETVCTVDQVPYDELNYGVDVYGKYEVTKTTTVTNP